MAENTLSRRHRVFFYTKRQKGGVYDGALINHEGFI